VHPKHIYRCASNVGAAKALDRVVARIAREEPGTPTDPTPRDEAAAAEPPEKSRSSASACTTSKTGSTKKPGVVTDPSTDFRVKVNPKRKSEIAERVERHQANEENP
jgi:hypothetical protein